jgi:hypothetical protein
MHKAGVDALRQHSSWLLRARCISHRPASEPNRDNFVMSHQLRRSALQRLAFLAAPIGMLWLFVAFALDVFA